MTSPGKRAAALVGSPRFATALLLLLALWAVVASCLGLPGAFTAPPFIVGVLLLAFSTAVCAWRRTGVARRRASILRAVLTGGDLPGAQRFEIVCDPRLDTDAILSACRTVFGRTKIVDRPDGTGLVAATPAWTLLGSPLFHWALVAVIVLIPLGGLVRSSGQMGLAVGQSKSDRPASYGLLTSGPLREWARVHRSIRVDDFELNYGSRGVDRGPTPTVSVLNEAGSVIKSQRVYPNHTLKTGSLAIYPAEYGLSADISLFAKDGTETRHPAELLDFSGKTDSGTIPVAPLVVESADETQHLTIYLSVPLDRTENGFLGRLPSVLRVRVLATSTGGQTVLDRWLRPGEDLALPTGNRLQLNGLGYYARLQLVDDPSIPLLYLAAAIAILGLGVATFSRQMIVVAQVVETTDGRRLNVTAQLWRSLTTSGDEIAAELERVLSTYPGEVQG